jgi:uncharacterized membrane protein
MAIGRLHILRTSLITSIVFTMLSSVAWLRLMRAQSMPLLTISVITSTESDAGPMLAIIFVFFTLASPKTNHLYGYMFKDFINLLF